jgi:hypothetical protein
MTLGPDARAAALEHDIPDYSDPPYGGRYGTLKPYHRSGSMLMLSGITPEDRDGTMLHPGRLGHDLTVEQGHAAARKTAINALGLITLAVGSLERVRGVGRSLGFVVATPEFTEHHLVGEGVSAVLMEVFGRRGLGGRADIGATSLSRGNCFELWLSVELDEEGIALVDASPFGDALFA